MPNPNVGNDEAAMYLAYYASKDMEREAVNRLYSASLQKKQSALLRAEAELYPSQPPVVRTQKQVQEYVEQVVKTDLMKRQQHLLEIERQVYHDPRTLDPAPLTPTRLKQHVKHMYQDQVQRFRRAEQNRLKEYGLVPEHQPMTSAGPASARSSSAVTPGRNRGSAGIAEVDANRQREAKWKPVATSPVHKDVFLHSKPPGPPVEPAGSEKHDMRELHEYFERLAKPLRVWQKAEHTKRRDPREEAFNLYPKFRKT